MPGFTLVGLPETTVKESRDRVRSAIINSQFVFPAKKNHGQFSSSGSLPKEGGRFDFTYCVGHFGCVEPNFANMPDRHEFIGELALVR